MKKHLSVLIASLLLSVVVNAEQNKKPSVFVTVPPQAGIVKQIAGNLVTVQPLINGANCPETYSPSPKQLEALSKTDLFLDLGMPFEEIWLKKAGVLGIIKTEHMSFGIKLRKNDPHIWTSINNVVTMAKNTTQALKNLMPEHSECFDKNLKEFEKKAEILDAKIKVILKDSKGKKLFVFHPYYGYFADSYGLEQIPIEDEGKSPTAKQLAKIIAEIKKQNNKIILTQPEFDTKIASSVAKEAGAKLVTASIYSEDILKNIEEIATKWK